MNQEIDYYLNNLWIIEEFIELATFYIGPRDQAR